MKKTTKIILISVGVVALAGLIIGPYLAIQNAKKVNFQYVTVTKADLSQEVSSTGMVKPVKEVSLSFEKSGKVAQVLVKVGDVVSIGHLLLQLDDTTIKAQLSQYQASLSAEQAKLAQLVEGPRPEEITIAQTKKQTAQQDLTDAQTDLVNIQEEATIDLANIYDDTADVLQAAYSQADSAVNKQIDDLFLNDTTGHPSLTFSTTDSNLTNAAENQRVLAGLAVLNIKSIIDNLTPAPTSLDNALAQAENNLIVVRDFFNVLTTALTASSGLAQTTINTYKGYANTARDDVNDGLSDVNTQKQAVSSQKITNQKNIDTGRSAVNSAKNALTLAEDQLALTLAGSSQEQINAQKALVEVAQANLSNTQAELAKTKLYSPINGIITKQEAKQGEVIAMNTPLVYIISQADFQVETNIPEVDTAKVKIGDTAKITLDAYGADSAFPAKITQIDPAETVIEGVTTYKTTLVFLEKDSRIKSGMTANIDILTAQKADVIALPNRAIIAQNNDRIVKVYQGDSKGQPIIEERLVILGLQGSNGQVEILSGVSLGEKVITFLEEK